jgi:hypothetical protein
MPRALQERLYKSLRRAELPTGSPTLRKIAETGIARAGAKRPLVVGALFI